MQKPRTFQDIIIALEHFWSARGCLIWQPHNVQVGAGTMNPATFLQVLGPEPWNVAYVEPSIRPADSRYGENPNRMQRFYQYQVILKPEPGNPQELYLQSLGALGIDCSRHDVRFVEDNWESPALGAWGLGWEVWLDGQEITQYTYFQQSGGLPCDPVSVELTYGLERIVMPLQGVRHFRDIEWAPGVSYGEVCLQAEVEHSRYNLDHADVYELKELFQIYEREASRLIGLGLVLPAYDFVLNCSHTFNILDARGAVGVTERAHFFNRMRALARNVARGFVRQREELEYPRLKSWRLVGGLDVPRPPAIEIPLPAEPEPFLLEIGVEELPAGDVLAGVEQLRTNAIQIFNDVRLTYAGLQVCGTPRRLVLFVESISPRQSDLEEEMRGPPARVAFDAEGKPTKAAEGFARSAGVAPDSLEIRREGDREYLVARLLREGRPAGQILSEYLPALISSLTFGKSMRWDGAGAIFSRPLRWFVSLLGSQIVPFTYAGLHAGRISYGLRPTGSPEIQIPDAASYFHRISQQNIMIDIEGRRQHIDEEACLLAQEVSGTVLPDMSLLDEVTNLIEYPHVMRGSYESSFLQLPGDVLIAVMRKHQRYFSVAEHTTGKILPYFIFVANGPALDEPLVKAGNEEVLRARFTDAAFFFKSDSEHKLEDFLPRLETLAFQEKLGSMRDKGRRLEKLAVDLGNHLEMQDHERKIVARAAFLCKADLATQMVIEITSLQGIMGREYALRGGEEKAVAQAIEEHYLPRTASDALPQSPAGMVLALADRVDSLLALVAAGLVPSGSVDPYGLRRAALGIVQILNQHRISISLKVVFEDARRILPLECDDTSLKVALDVVAGRLRGWLLDRGLRYDVVEAALGGCGDNPYRASQVAHALGTWVVREDWPALLAAYSRCVRIVRGMTCPYDLRPELLTEPAASALYAAYLICRGAINAHTGADDFFQAFRPMVEPINRFFDDILVMTEDQDVRQARLGLLQRIAGLPAGIMDLSKIEGF